VEIRTRLNEGGSTRRTNTASRRIITTIPLMLKAIA